MSLELDSAGGSSISTNQAPLLLSSCGTSDHTLYESPSKNKLIMIAISILLLFVITAVVVGIYFVLLNDSSSINWKQRFLSIPDSTKIDEYSKIYTAKPHIAGSPENMEYGYLLKQQLDSFGYTTNTTMSDIISNVWLSQYVSSSLSQLNFNGNEILHFNLSEEIIEEDATSNTTMRHEAYLGYAPQDQCEGCWLIYVNYASRDDFEYLVSRGYDLNGLVGIARYGGNVYRGHKVKLAEQYGLYALIIYNDPAEYGYSLGSVYPIGPWLPDSGYQRGTIMYHDICPGDPNPVRVQSICSREGQTVQVLPGITAIPLSYKNAEILLSQLGGEQVPNDTDVSWQGGLPFIYFIGGNNADISVLLNLTVNNDLLPTDILNVVGYIEGYKYKNESVLIGAARDAWIYGAAASVSGTTVLLEIARAFGEMIDDGWKPLRNIYIASWDASEFSFIGSTHFVDTFEEFVDTELIAYINLDIAVSGPNLSVGSSPILSKKAIDSMKDILRPYNDTDITLYQRWFDRNGFNNSNETQLNELGDSSDFIPFVNRFNIPSISSGFNGLFGTYHSVYDSYNWMKKIDPQFEFARVMTQYVGLMAFELLNNDILPYNMTNLGVMMNQWRLNEIATIQNKFDCFINETQMDSLKNVIYEFTLIAMQFDGMVDGIDGNDEEEIVSCNNAMKQFPKQFLYSDGLPERVYFKNILIAPSDMDGYGNEVFPLITFPIKYNCNPFQVEHAINVTNQAIVNATNYLAAFISI